MVLNSHALYKKLHTLWNHRATLVFSLLVMTLACICATSWADALYIITGTDDAAIVLDGSAKVPDLSSQMVYVTSGGKGYDVTLAAGQTVTIHHNGETVSAKSKKETISKLLDRLHIVPGPLEMVAVDLSGSGAELTISSDITYYDKVAEPVAFETVRVANPDMEKGTEKVVQEGADGVRTSIYEVVWSNGEQVSRQFV